MNTLIRFEAYSREEVHSIFSSHTRFTPQAGTWGLQGIVPIPNRSGDYVFFVTFGQEQGEHAFDESITLDGVLTWQSQPSQTFKHSQIKDFINHDELVNSIYLFLRTRTDINYTYLGKLKYLSHDAERENPVWFQWQIIDWCVQSDVFEQIGLQLQDAAQITHPKQRLEKTEAPSILPRQGISTNEFRSRKMSDHSEVDAHNNKIGLAGELLILEYEQKSLRESGQYELAEQVVHVSQIEGDGAGYDIRSFKEDGTEKYIEVKTTTGNKNTSFFISSNELALSARNADNYYLYRVYDYDSEQNTGRFYLVHGDLGEALELSPIQYRATPR